MRVLHVIDSLVLGGAEVLVKDLAPRIRARGIDFQVMVLRLTGSPVEKAVREANVPVLHTGVKRLYSPRNIARLVPLIDGYDVVHVQLFPAQLWAAAAFALRHRKARLITTEQNTWNYRRDHRIFRPVDAWMYSQYELILCNSQATLDQLATWCPHTKPKLRVLHNGVPLQEFETATPADLNGLIPQELPKLVFTARFHPQKDHATLLRALTKVPKAQLLLVGDGELRSQLQQLASDLHVADRVTFLGHRTDVAKILKACDIYVHPTNSDGFGIAACEAMAAGLPVVVSDVPGLAQVVEGAGMLFPPGDHETLARELNFLLESPERRHEMQVLSRNRARCFDIERIADEHADVYRSLVHEGLA